MVDDALEAMRRDAQRYEFLREHLGQLTMHTDGRGWLCMVEVNPRMRQLDPGSIDSAIDAAMRQEGRPDG
jgi:hypothetical protein